MSTIAFAVSSLVDTLCAFATGASFTGLTVMATLSLSLRPPSLVKTYDSGNYHDVLASGDVWLAQGWNGQFAKAMEQNPDIGYVLLRGGASLFIDNLAIPASSPHPALAHAFIDAIDRASILETVRTGASGIGRGERILRV